MAAAGWRSFARSACALRQLEDRLQSVPSLDRAGTWKAIFKAVSFNLDDVATVMDGLMVRASGILRRTFQN